MTSTQDIDWNSLEGLGPGGDLGGFGDLRRARLRSSGEWVVLKFLRDFANGELRRRFAREVRMLLAFRCDSVVEVLGADLEAARPYYVMKYAPGGSLQGLAGRLSPASVLGIAATIAEVLARIHAAGGLHRDVKPANILLDDRGLPRLGDFGLGNAPGCTSSVTNTAAGTSGFIAPELYLPFATATPASDVFSLGATLYTLATGCVAAEQAASLNILAQCPGAPLELSTLVLELTSPSPGRRPSAAAVAERLARVPRGPILPANKSDWVEAAVAVGGVVFGVLLLGALIEAAFES